MASVDTITEGAPIIARALAHRAEQGAVTFLFGSAQIRAERLLRRDGRPIDPMGSDAALQRLDEAFSADGWTVHVTRDEEHDEITAATFEYPDS